MAYVKNEDIIGYRVNQEEVCVNCITEIEEEKQFALDDIITAVAREQEAGKYFCDRCKKEM